METEAPDQPWANNEEGRVLTFIDGLVVKDQGEELAQLWQNPYFDNLFPNAPGPFGYTPLGRAILLNNTKALEAILKHPFVDPNKIAGGWIRHDLTTFTLAMMGPMSTAKHGGIKADLFRLLLAHPRLMINARSPLSGITNTQAALAHRSPYFLKKLMTSHRFNINERNAKGESPLGEVLLANKDKHVRVILESPLTIVNPTREEMDATSSLTNSPMAKAVENGSLTQLRLLLSAGADPTLYETHIRQISPDEMFNLYTLNYVLLQNCFLPEQYETRLKVAELLKEGGGDTYIDPLVIEAYEGRYTRPEQVHFDLVNREIIQSIPGRPLSLADQGRLSILNELRQMEPRLSLRERVNVYILENPMPQPFRKFLKFGIVDLPKKSNGV